jgi:hypothetical protein
MGRSADGLYVTWDNYPGNQVLLDHRVHNPHVVGVVPREYFL